MEYPIVVGPLAEEDGGGFVGYAPDLVGCISDGETPEEALANANQAVLEWIETAKQRGLDVPPPGSMILRHKAEQRALAELARQLARNVDATDSRLQELDRAIKKLTEERSDIVPGWGQFVEADRPAA